MKKSLLFALTSCVILFGLITIAFNDDATFNLPDEYKTFTRIAKTRLADMPEAQAWKEAAPEVKTIKIKSTADGTEQPALFYDSGSERKKPLLVVLHSWSVDYQQYYSIPYALWARQNDYVFIHPNYRGAFNKPEATASEKALQDILDAVDYAKKNANIDESRVYLEGYSGGAMVALIMAGKHPEIWAGVVAWVPVYDLVKWYERTKNATHDYSDQIAASCGGVPTSGSAAESECRKRSPSQYLENARGKDINIYIAAGIEDSFVPPDHAMLAFNVLADEDDRIPDEHMKYIASKHKMPEELAGDYPDKFYDAVELKSLFERKSENVLLKIFQGNHDIVYSAGLHWLSQQEK